MSHPPTGTGTLWGVGLGPGDPELVTVKAARVIGEADVVAYHSARHGRSIARTIAAPYLRDGQLEEHLVYPVTTEVADHPGGYAGAMDDFYRKSAERIAAHLDAGRDVALLAEGDPLFYSSYMHMHTRLTERFDAVIVPGVTSVSAASAALSTPLVQGDEVLTILPGTLPPAELTRRLADSDAAVILKLGRSYPAVRQALSDAGRLDDAFYVERASSTAQRVLGHRHRRGGLAQPSLLLGSLDDVEAELGLHDADLADVEAQAEVLEGLDQGGLGRAVVALAAGGRAGVLGQLLHQRLDLAALLDRGDGLLDQRLELGAGALGGARVAGAVELVVAEEDVLHLRLVGHRRARQAAPLSQIAR